MAGVGSRSHNVPMFKRIWLVATGVVLLVLGVVFLIVGLDNADKIASVVGAISGVLGLALSVTGGPSAVRTIRAYRTGDIRRHKGTAVTGVRGSASLKADQVVAKRTGNIEGGDGNATTGVHLGP